MEIPVLDMTLNEIETGLAMIVPDYYDLQVAESEIIEPEAATDAPAWKLTLKTTAPVKTVPNPKDGKQETLEIGHPLFNQQQLAPTGKATAKMVAQNVGAIIQALKPTMPPVKLHEIKQWHKTVEGRIVRVHVICQAAGTSKTGKAYRAGNRIDEWLKA